MELDKIKEILKESIGAPTAKMDMNLSKILMSMLDSIAQQDYIIIEWEGKDSTDAAKKAEVDAILKNAFLANPLSMFSIIFKDYGGGLFTTVTGYSSDGESVAILLAALEEPYQFGIL